MGEEGFEPSLFCPRATGFTDRRNTAVVAALPCAERDSNPQKDVFETSVSACCTIGANKKGHLFRGGLFEQLIPKKNLHATPDLQAEITQRKG